jgi:ABC-type amino acid transport substrate-binding protein
MAFLRAGFEAKASEFKSVLKIGRTQLQDAVPMTLGQEFSTYAVMMEEDEDRLREARALIQEINLGATAIGTGINAPHGYAEIACRHLAEISGVPVVKAKNLVEATQDTGAFVQLSGVLKRVATKLSKTCNDLRLLSSGPQAGFGDIKLPPRQAGSSIMPGKVNPVIPEVMNQVAFEVIGNDITVTMASEAGQLQLNAFEPIMGWSLHKSIRHLSNACITLQANCVAGIEANHELLARRVRESVTLVTALNPIIGYEKAALIAKTAIATGAGIDVVAEGQRHHRQGQGLRRGHHGRARFVGRPVLHAGRRQVRRLPLRAVPAHPGRPREGRRQEARIKYQPVTSQNRIPLVQNGTVDIECGSTTNNATRQKDVSFAVTTYVEEVRIAVKANSGIKSVADLNGKTVATTTGTTSVQLLRKNERAQGIDFKEVFGKDHADSFLLLESGRADAFVMDGNILAGNIATVQEPGRLQDRRRDLSVEPIAIMIRKDDPAFKKLVDDTSRP